MISMLTLIGVVQARKALQHALHLSYTTLKATAQLATDSATELANEVIRQTLEAIEPQLTMEEPMEDKPVRLPHLLTVVCGFAKSHLMYPYYECGKFGDDAWFKTSTTTTDVLGVADGVGGWRNHGIDPGEFSSFLMRCCSRLVHENSYDVTMPVQLLARSYCNLLDQKQLIHGSSTACVLSYNRKNGMLYTANLGDSGFIVYRNGAIVCRSHEQQHYFNTPFQLSAPPLDKNLNVLADSPDCAELQQFSLQIGDVILLATDGVYDNIPEDMLTQILEDAAHESDPRRLQMTANCLAYVARTLSFNPDYESPFCINARFNNIDAPGGKPDDITVLLATVCK